MDDSTQTKARLSTVPSKAIPQALDDMNECIRDDDYTINMDDYHIPLFDLSKNFVLCQVCFAGSTMAKRCGVSMYLDPFDYGYCCSHEFEHARDMFKALDNFRLGNIKKGLKNIGLGLPKDMPPTVPIADYKSGLRTQFHKDMRKLAAQLKSYGL